MLNVNLLVAIAAYAGGILILLAGIWMWIELNAHSGYLGGLGATQKKWRCQYCGYVYLGSGDEEVSQCPRCESYNEI
jgi:hypothetical protein